MSAAAAVMADTVTIPRALYDDVLAKLHVLAVEQSTITQLREQIDRIYALDLVERGLIFYQNGGNYPRAAGGRFGPGTGAKAGAGGTGKAAGGAAKGAKAAGTAKAVGAAKKPRATKAAKATVSQAASVADPKAAAELRVSNAKTALDAAEKRHSDAEKKYNAAEKIANEKRAKNADEINRLVGEERTARFKASALRQQATEQISEERARAKGESGKAPKTYAKMQAAKQPYEDAKVAYAAAKAKSDASVAHADALMQQYRAGYDLTRPGEFDRMRKDHPDFKAAYNQRWKDESARDKAQYALYRKENTYIGARDQLAGKIDDAALSTHAEYAAAKARLDDVNARLDAATGSAELRPLHVAREQAHAEMEQARAEVRNAETNLTHGTWKYPESSAPTHDATYHSVDQWPAKTLEDAHAVDTSYRNSDRHVGDPALQELQHIQGFDGQPDIVSEDDLNGYVKNGEVELWRGDTNRSANYTDQFMIGEYHTGLGIRGNGTYAQEAAVDGHNVARSYAKDKGADGHIMRMTVKSDAKVIEYDDLKQRCRDAVQKAKSDEAAAKARGDLAGVRRAKTVRWLAEGNNSSHYATALGYDAIRIQSHAGQKLGQWIILNRTALRISNQIRRD